MQVIRINTMDRTISLFLALCALQASACSSDSSPNDAGNESATPTNSAVLVAGQAYTPEDYLTYVRVFPQVPEGNVDFSEFREFGNANVTVHDGRVFVEQDGVMQRFSVNEALKLVDGPRFTWADLGIPTANATSTVFISSTRAYTFAPQLGVIVVWNPDTMKRTGVIELEFPERAEGMDTWATDGRVVGDKVIWNVFSGDFTSLVPYPALTLAIADAQSDAPPTFVEDSRCLPGGPSFLDANGDYYVHGGGYFGYFYAYGNVPASRTCVLRVKAGEAEFDPEYLLDYEQVTGSYVNTPWIQVSGDRYLTRAWDPSTAFPELADDFWTVQNLRPLLVDASAGTTVPYPGIAGFSDVDGQTRIVDGVSYFQLSESGYVEGGDTDVVALHPSGVEQKFHLGGFLLTLDRVR
ncbi:MAG: hypothetical protein QM756_06565 [Polyangiaceae bacterium]